MLRLLVVVALWGATVLSPAAARAVPAHTLGAPVFVDAAPTAVTECASAEQSAWSFSHRTAPFAAPYAGGVVRMAFNQPMAYGESHPDFYTDVPVGLPDFTMPAGTVAWSYAPPADASRQVSIPFVCPAQGASFDVRLDFFATPAAPVTYTGHGTSGQWSLLVVQVGEPSVLSVQAGGVPLAYRFDDPKAATQIAAPGQAVMLGTVSSGEHGLFVAPQAAVESDWTASFTAASAAGPSGGYGGEEPTAGQASTPVSTKLRPVMRKRPRVVGVARVGRTVACNRGTFTGARKFTTRWRRGGKLVAGRVGSTYRLRAADRGFLLTCQVRAANDAGSVTVQSAPVRVRRAG